MCLIEKLNRKGYANRKGILTMYRLCTDWNGANMARKYDNFSICDICHSSAKSNRYRNYFISWNLETFFKKWRQSLDAGGHSLVFLRNSGIVSQKYTKAQKLLIA